VEGDASAFGILPPYAVRIAFGKQVDDWPAYLVSVLPDRIVIADPQHGRPLVAYAYTSSWRASDGRWQLTGPDGAFTVEPGPIEDRSANGDR
jgi:hypothetical protein